jgi:hypothetical protein
VLRLTQVGGTVLQSLVEGIVVGATLKYVRGSAGSGTAVGATVNDVFESSGESPHQSTNAFDLDLGLMADFRRVRVGAVVRNVREPAFETPAGVPISLKRQARLGLAVLPTAGLTLALDVDLDRVDLRDGLRRMIALGGEDRLGERVAVRAGVRWSLEGERRPVGAAGVSVAIRPRWWVDAHVTAGGDGVDRGFGVALRAGL